jgi:hypothetical protein
VPSRFVVVVAADAEAVAALATAAGASVVDDSRTDVAGDTVAVLLFPDGLEQAASRTGTVFGSQWAALEHARHKASVDDRRHEATHRDGTSYDEPPLVYVGVGSSWA